MMVKSQNNETMMVKTGYNFVFAIVLLNFHNCGIVVSLFRLLTIVLSYFHYCTIVSSLRSMAFLFDMCTEIIIMVIKLLFIIGLVTCLLSGGITIKWQFQQEGQYLYHLSAPGLGPIQLTSDK